MAGETLFRRLDPPSFASHFNSIVMPRILLLLLAIAALVALASAGPAGHASVLRRSPSFDSSVRHHHPRSLLFDGGASSDDDNNYRRSASASCSECTKAFCLSQGIGFCKDAKDENVVTMCFQRDSNKDKIIVWGFILGTVGLLGWTAFKRVVEWRDGRGISRQDINYTPMVHGQ
ncbi:MFS transporter [Drechmeria coniospora]|uniref:MFS transporter n=1 Tax=Drechmeria coniospora TaxID=98403 RepID=A0A151GT46_DRECN|nr:MFS transporter [Drechmeria coniospora]KYK60241.1 MFS transporter [Drechmeria coniospora]